MSAQEVESGAGTEQEYLDFLSWLQTGTSRGWISEPVCVTHHGLPNTEEEEAEWEEGFDPCVPGVRIWLQ